MLRITPRDLNEEADVTRLVSNPKPVDQDFETFTEDGIFSTGIFGKLGGSEDWACKCNNPQLFGEFNEGVLCPRCNTRVSFQGASLEREGWIDLVHLHIHPLFYRYMRKVIGPQALEKILHYKGDIHVGGELLDVELSYPYHGIGMEPFIQNFSQILDDYMRKKTYANPEAVERAYNFIKKHEDLIFIQYFPIINSKLRPAIVINGEYSFDAINTPYNGILQNTRILSKLTSAERNPLNVYQLCFKNQQLINSIYEQIITVTTTHDGYIRGTALGNRLNFTSRMVITPLGGDSDMDEVHIPYVSAVELFKPQIIRKLAILKRITLTHANELWFKATLAVDKQVLSIMNALIKEQNINMLINRNPTIGVGSIMLLRISGIKEDYSDHTASIHNLILSPLGADYDGDVLNFILVFSTEFTEYFDKFRPHNILVDADTGGFNTTFLPAKDTLLGLITLMATPVQAPAAIAQTPQKAKKKK